MIPKNKTISILHPYVNKVGGAVKMMIYLASLLKKEGNDVKFYTFSYDKNLFQDVNFEIIVSSKLEIAYKIKKSDYIIIGNSPMQFVGVFSKILFRSKAKLIRWHHHYPWYYNKNANILTLIKRLLEKSILKYFDLFLANSEYLRLVLKNIYKVESQVLYPTITYPVSKFLSQNKGEKIVFTYGRRVKGKNIEQIFETYSYLKNNCINVKLLVGGVGDELESFKEKYKVDKNVKFLGMLDSLSIMKNFSKASVFLFPSLIDSFGMTILEAIFAGVPTIAFDINSAKELIDNGKTGFLVNNSLEFSQKTEYYLTKCKLCEVFEETRLKKMKTFNELRFKKKLEEIF